MIFRTYLPFSNGPVSCSDVCTLLVCWLFYDKNIIVIDEIKDTYMQKLIIRKIENNRCVAGWFRDILKRN